jgi:hypothetical protein
LIFFVAQHFLPATAQESALADPVPSSAIEASLHIPSELGRVEIEHRAGGERPFVILIRDAHAVIEAQSNIERLIRHFQEKYGVRHVALEGGEGKLDPLLFRAFPDETVKRRVLGGYLERGDLAGTEMAAIFNPEGGQYRAIEDWGLYQANYLAYLQAREVQKAILDELAAKEKAFDEQRKSVYRPELNRFHEAERTFREEKLALAEFLKFMKEDAAMLGVDLGPYLEVATLLSAMEREATLTGENTAAAVRGLAENFRRDGHRRWGRGEVMEFNRSFQAFLTGNLEASAFLKFMVEMAAAKGETLALGPELGGLLRQYETLSMIQGTKFGTELENLIGRLREGHMKSPAEKELAEGYLRAERIGKLARLEVSREEFNAYAAARIEHEALLRNPRVLNAALDFYATAFKRDDAMARRLEGWLADTGAKSAVLVLGGFHSAGLEERLHRQGFSYAVVTPAIHSLQGQEHYDAVMQGHLSYREFLGTSFYDAFVRHSFARLAEELDEPAFRRTVKAWRDGVIRGLARERRLSEAGDYTRYVDEMLTHYVRRFGTDRLVQKDRAALIQEIGSRIKRAQDESLRSVWNRFEERVTQGVRDLARRKTTGKVSAREVTDAFGLVAHRAVLIRGAYFDDFSLRTFVEKGLRLWNEGRLVKAPVATRGTMKAALYNLTGGLYDNTPQLDKEPFLSLRAEIAGGMEAAGLDGIQASSVQDAENKLRRLIDEMLRKLPAEERDEISRRAVAKILLEFMLQEERSSPQEEAASLGLGSSLGKPSNEDAVQTSREAGEAELPKPGPEGKKDYALGPQERGKLFALAPLTPLMVMVLQAERMWDEREEVLRTQIDHLIASQFPDAIPPSRGPPEASSPRPAPFIDLILSFLSQDETIRFFEAQALELIPLGVPPDVAVRLPGLIPRVVNREMLEELAAAVAGLETVQAIDTKRIRDVSFRRMYALVDELKLDERARYVASMAYFGPIVEEVAERFLFLNLVGPEIAHEIFTERHRVNASAAFDDILRRFPMDGVMGLSEALLWRVVRRYFHHGALKLFLELLEGGPLAPLQSHLEHNRQVLAEVFAQAADAPWDVGDLPRLVTRAALVNPLIWTEIPANGRDLQIPYLGEAAFQKMFNEWHPMKDTETGKSMGKMLEKWNPALFRRNMTSIEAGELTAAMQPGPEGKRWSSSPEEAAVQLWSTADEAQALEITKEIEAYPPSEARDRAILQALAHPVSKVRVVASAKLAASLSRDPIGQLVDYLKRPGIPSRVPEQMPDGKPFRPGTARENGRFAALWAVYQLAKRSRTAPNFAAVKTILDGQAQSWSDANEKRLQALTRGNLKSAVGVDEDLSLLESMRLALLWRDNFERAAESGTLATSVDEAKLLHKKLWDTEYVGVSVKNTLTLLYFDKDPYGVRKIVTGERGSSLGEIPFAEGRIYSPEFIRAQRKRSKKKAIVAVDLDHTLIDPHTFGVRAALVELLKEYKGRTLPDGREVGYVLWTAGSKGHAEAAIAINEELEGLFAGVITRENYRHEYDPSKSGSAREQVYSNVVTSMKPFVKNAAKRVKAATIAADSPRVKNAALLGYAAIIDDNITEVLEPADAIAKALKRPFTAIYGGSFRDDAIFDDEEDARFIQSELRARLETALGLRPREKGKKPALAKVPEPKLSPEQHLERNLRRLMDPETVRASMIAQGVVSPDTSRFSGEDTLMPFFESHMNGVAQVLASGAVEPNQPLSAQDADLLVANTLAMLRFVIIGAARSGRERAPLYWKLIPWTKLVRNLVQQGDLPANHPLRELVRGIFTLGDDPDDTLHFWYEDLQVKKLTLAVEDIIEGASLGENFPLMEGVTAEWAAEYLETHDAGELRAAFLSRARARFRTLREEARAGRREVIQELERLSDLVERIVTGNLDAVLGRLFEPAVARGLITADERDAEVRKLAAQLRLAVVWESVATLDEVEGRGVDPVKTRALRIRFDEGVQRWTEQMKGSFKIKRPFLINDPGDQSVVPRVLAGKFAGLISEVIIAYPSSKRPKLKKDEWGVLPIILQSYTRDARGEREIEEIMEREEPVSTFTELLQLSDEFIRTLNSVLVEIDLVADPELQELLYTAATLAMLKLSLLPKAERDHYRTDPELLREFLAQDETFQNLPSLPFQMRGRIVAVRVESFLAEVMAAELVETAA